MVNELPPDQPDEDQPSAREGVFSGVRIVDFSSGIAGPYATMFLADHGADVIKVESPGGDPFRASPGFETLNRGKRSVRLDHTSDSGRNRTRLLGRLADVVVVDLPQGRAEERGIGYDQLAAANPGLVYLAMPPYGDAGPMVDRPSSPALLAAVSGIMAGQASYSGNPSYVVLPIRLLRRGSAGGGGSRGRTLRAGTVGRRSAAGRAANRGRGGAAGGRGDLGPGGDPGTGAGAGRVEGRGPDLPAVQGQ